MSVIPIRRRPIMCVCEELNLFSMRVVVFYLDAFNQVQSNRFILSLRALDQARFDLLTESCLWSIPN